MMAGQNIAGVGPAAGRLGAVARGKDGHALGACAHLFSYGPQIVFVTEGAGVRWIGIAGPGSARTGLGACAHRFPRDCHGRVWHVKAAASLVKASLNMGACAHRFLCGRAGKGVVRVGADGHGTAWGGEASSGNAWALVSTGGLHE